MFLSATSAHLQNSVRDGDLITSLGNLLKYLIHSCSEGICTNSQSNGYKENFWFWYIAHRNGSLFLCSQPCWYPPSLPNSNRLPKYVANLTFWDTPAHPVPSSFLPLQQFYVKHFKSDWIFLGLCLNHHSTAFTVPNKLHLLNCNYWQLWVLHAKKSVVNEHPVRSRK